MASLFTHAFAAAALTAAFRPPPRPVRLWVCAVALSILPDIDAVGYWLGIRYDGLFGHRGLAHSLLFAFCVGFLTAAVGWRSRPPWLPSGLFLSSVMASHGILDALTDGGYGVAFFSPFDPTRYFFPWRPLPVSPLGPEGFFGSRGAAILFAEILWVWFPLILLAAGMAGLRRASPQE